jgi:cytochrome P450
MPAVSRPPGPRGLPFVGVLPQVRRDPVRAFQQAAADYGDFVFMRVGAYNAYLVSRPADIKHVLQDNYANYRKSPLYERIKDAAGHGLLTSEGSFWLRQRRLAQPAFHRERLAAMVETMQLEIARTASRWQRLADSGDTVDIGVEMMDLTQRIIVRTMFSTELGEAAAVINRTWPVINRHIGEALWRTPIEARLPLPSNRRFRRALAELDTVVYRIIDARRRSGDDVSDLLSLLLAARDADTGERMDDLQLRDEVITMLLAGHETTSLALSWTYYLLSNHADVDVRLVDEAAREPSRGDAATLDHLVYARMVVSESLRLFPPAWGFSRQALGDDEIGGFRVPKGSLVFIAPYVVHRRPALWPDPERFDPERFSASQTAARARFAYVPFGGGPRQCIGNQFAMLEATLILASLARRFRVEVLSGQRIRPEPLITLRPSPAVLVRIVERRAAA